MSHNPTLHSYQPYYPTTSLSLTPFASIAIRNEAAKPSWSSTSTSSYWSSKYGQRKPTVENALGVPPLFLTYNLYSSGDSGRHCTLCYDPSWLFHSQPMVNMFTTDGAAWECVSTATLINIATTEGTGTYRRMSSYKTGARFAVRKRILFRHHDQNRSDGVTCFLWYAYQHLCRWNYKHSAVKFTHFTIWWRDYACVKFYPYFL